MKLPPLQRKQQQPYDLRIRVEAGSETEAKQMQEAIQSFVSHFSLEEMKSAAHKLKSPVNRKMIKTFL